MSQELVSQAIIKTLAYHDLFDYPLTKEEIYKWLISDQRASLETLSRVLSTSEVSASVSEVGTLLTSEVGMSQTPEGETLSTSEVDGKTSEVSAFYFLRGREEIVEKRKRRGVISAAKIKKAKRISWLARLVPWVKLVGITGALAMANCEEDDDIDWLIITAPHRLWSSRACLVGLLLVLRQYRRPNRIKDKICPNVWLTEDHLKFPPEQRNLFLAHEIVQMKPLWSRNYTYEKLLNENGWIEKFLTNAYRWQMANGKWQNHMSNLKTDRRIPIVSMLLDKVDNLLGSWQKKIMAEKVTTETIGDGVLKFHPNDVSAKVLTAYQERIQSLVINFVA